MKKKQLPKKELQMIKDNFKGTVLLSSDSVESRMSSIAKNEIFLGRHYTVEQVCRQIDAVTAADIQRVARQLFETKNRSVLALGPKPSKAVRGKTKWELG